MAKIKVLTKDGRVVTMSEAALKIAERHFGVTRLRETPSTPIELKKMEKIQIIKAVEAPVAKKEPGVIKVEETVHKAVRKPVSKSKPATKKK